MTRSTRARIRAISSVRSAFIPPATADSRDKLEWLLPDCEGGLVPGIRTGAPLPHAAVDPISGVLYAVWQDSRFRTDGRSDIAMSVSTDGGASWSPASRVNHVPPNGG